MSTGLSGNIALTALGSSGSQTFLNEVTVSVPTTATKCFVTANGAVCGGDPTTNSGIRVAYAKGNAALADYNSGAGACWLGPRIQSPSASTCSSCPAFAVIDVTGGGSYSFGCDVVMFTATTNLTGACQANAVCF